LSSAYKNFATITEKDQINQSVQQTEDWLYQDSDDESVKLKDLKKLLDPIEKRYGDDIAKAKGTKAMMALIEKYRSATNSMPLRQKHMVYTL
ncbi:heat shock protein 70 family protein, partial [Tanacetum coccineum]